MIITLLTDFGDVDPFVGVMKGVILGRFVDARIVDLTHQIRAHAPREAAFWLSRSFRWFPPGTVHVAVVDPGVGTSRGILCARASSHVFLAPDNGLLGPVLDADPNAEVRRFELAVLDRLQLARPSATFHGRDIFAPIAAELARGGLRFEELGPPAGEVFPSALPPIVKGEARVDGEVVTIDRFGNLITQIPRESFAGFADPVVELGGHTIDVVRTYGERAPGAIVALVNAFDVLEIARVEGRADEHLGVVAGAGVAVSPRSR